jgi:hypothetical protein
VGGTFLRRLVEHRLHARFLVAVKDVQRALVDLDRADQLQPVLLRRIEGHLQRTRLAAAEVHQLHEPEEPHAAHRLVVAPSGVKVCS